ncbi:MAG: DUF805 domain-containing protein [Euryarchaeota archaeon]|nr:DUF805 domain-containing protein [Euryarchaeota archaeon]
MSFMDAVKSGLGRWNDFSGRSSRSEYWFLYLFGMVFQIGGFVLMMVHEIFGFVLLIGLLMLIIPFISVSVRRLHDVGQSGWMLLIGVIPIVNFIGSFVLLYWFIFGAGEEQENRFGPVPTNMLE